MSKLALGRGEEFHFGRGHCRDTQGGTIKTKKCHNWKEKWGNHVYGERQEEICVFLKISETCTNSAHLYYVNYVDWLFFHLPAENDIIDYAFDYSLDGD